MTANYDYISLVSHILLFLIRQGPWSGHTSVCRCSSFEVFLWFDRVVLPRGLFRYPFQSLTVSVWGFVVVVDRFYIALFSALEQTLVCALVCDSE